MSKTNTEKWMRRYYPETAAAVVERVGGDKVALLQHSLRKWRGLRPRVLKALGLGAEIGDKNFFGRQVVGDVAFFNVDAYSCALCEAFPCTDCPLLDLKRRARMFGCEPEFTQFCDEGDPEPMIKALENALRREKRKKGRNHGTT